MASALLLALAPGPTGCLGLTAQLPPADLAALEQVPDRQEREDLYQSHAIVTHPTPQGPRYTKGTNPRDEPRSWQSLDAVLRSDRHSAEALPVRKLRQSRVLVALTVIAGLATVAGAAASAREGLDLDSVSGPGAILLGGGIATVALGIGAGITFGQARAGYERAVIVYNDSLAMRLGLLDGRGQYRPPGGVFIDKDGYVLLDEPEARLGAGAPEGPPAAPPAAGDAEPSTTAPPATDATDAAPLDAPGSAGVAEQATGEQATSGGPATPVAPGEPPASDGGAAAPDDGPRPAPEAAAPPPAQSVPLPSPSPPNDARTR